MILPPRLLKAHDVPAYIREKHGVEVSRQTIYNWMNKGREGVVLDFIETKSDPGCIFKTIRVVTEAKLNEFLRRAGIIGG